MRRVLSLLFLTYLVACAPSQSLITLKNQEISGENFASMLARGYLEYAQSLEEENQQGRAEYYAQKGLAAARGKAPLPDDSSSHDASRELLMSALTPDVTKHTPKKAAHAQLMFDCWADGSELCHENFDAALADIQFVADTLVHGEANRFVVRFEPESDALDARANTVLDVIKSKVRGMGAYQIELLAANQLMHDSIEKKRIHALKEALIARGIESAHLHAHHGRTSHSEVYLSSDRQAAGDDAVILSIQSYGQASEAREP